MDTLGFLHDQFNFVNDNNQIERALLDVKMNQYMTCGTKNAKRFKLE